MSVRKLPGKFVWFEAVGGDPRRAQVFYREVLGWKAEPAPMGSYEMIYAGDAMIGGYAPAERAPAHWISCVSVEDLDRAVAATREAGGRVVEEPVSIWGVGRRARIADPQGAELVLFENAMDDPADDWATHGRWVWNELHTSDADGALAFYAKVLGFTAKTMAGPGGPYHILEKDGVGRAGVTTHGGEHPHWLPYVSVDDVDAALARAKQAGAKMCVPPMDIPGVGRIGFLEDPNGAALAVMKPVPGMS